MKTEPVFLNVFMQCLRQSLRVGLTVSAVITVLILLMGNIAQAEVITHIEADEAQIIDSPGQMKSGGLLFKSAGQFSKAPILHTDVHTRVSGMIARTRVKQTFTNPEKVWQEGIYVFPLPETTAVDRLRMHIGERIIEGQIKEKLEAKKQYQTARRAGKKASLVEQERPNIFTTSLANIGPGEQITVEIEYQQVVRYEQGRFSLRFPMVVAPRYIPGETRIKGFSGSGWAYNTNEVEDAARITPPVIAEPAKAINPVSISIDLDAGFAIENINSAYHEITLQKLNRPGQYQVQLKKESIPANRDFQLSWNVTANSRPQAALFRENLNGDDYALVMVAPPQHQQELILKREIIFVIDTSGSMAGTSIVQAKAALQLALARLRPGEHFNIIQFNSYTSQLFQYPRLVSPESINQAQSYIKGLQANGGTQMAAAVRAALANQSNTLDIRQVVFLTDGSVGNENALFQEIKNLLGASRLFTIGIGSAPNSHFMNRAARFGRGSHTYIGDIAEVQEKMNALFSKLENPVLSNIVVDAAGLNGAEVWPQHIPDLYLGEPLLLSIKAENLPETIKIKGQLSDSIWQTELSLEGGQQRAGVSGLWARRKIAALMDQNARGEEHQNVRQQILDTALEHHLVSKYTSLLAVDVTPTRAQNDPLLKRALPVNLPAGWQHNKVFTSMPQTATPATLYLILGFLLLFSGSVLKEFSMMFKKLFIRLILLTLPLCGIWMLAQGGYIHAKARVAQILLETAWTETLNGRQEVKPWPWADTWPVGRLSVPRLGIHRIVLAGANGSALAFGPGHLFESAKPGESGHVIIAGHRDTHFQFLQDLRIGDVLELQTAENKTLVYRISDTAVVDENDTRHLSDNNDRLLTLVTCYPFNAINGGSERRYLVIARYKIARSYI